MVAGFYQAQGGVNGCHAGGECVAEARPFEGGEVPFQRQTRGVRGARVLEALVFSQAFLRVSRSLIDRNCYRAGGGVRLLAGVNCDGGKTHRSK